VRASRSALGISQGGYAERVMLLTRNDCRISPTWVSQVEHDRLMPRPKRLRAIATIIKSLGPALPNLDDATASTHQAFQAAILAEVDRRTQRARTRALEAYKEWLQDHISEAEKKAT
jgi:transcriptional regulator with XRE-family HTH domain